MSCAASSARAGRSSRSSVFVPGVPSRERAFDGVERTTAKRSTIAPALLARHYGQLRTSRGTVLLGEPAAADAAPDLDPGWFVTDCPLDPEGAVEAIRARHGYASRSSALRALRKARDTLAKAKDPAAAALDDLP